jgi:TRAP-type uncharacterized transport system fused permease subunit
MTLVSLVVVSFFRRNTRLTPKKLFAAMDDSGKGMINIIPLCAAVGIILGSLLLTGSAINLSSGLLKISGGSTFLLLALAAIASLILGMGMTAVTCYILTVALMGPALIKSGIEPIAAHMFLFYFGTISFITPPVSIGAYVAAGIAGANPWQTGIRAVLLGAAAFVVPWSFAYNPALLLSGSIVETIREFVLCCLGGIFISPAVVGYLWLSPRRIRMLDRILLGAAAVVLLAPFSNYLLVGGALIVLTGVTFKNVMPLRTVKPTTN